MLYAIVFTFWMISPADTSFEGIVQTKMSGPVCIELAQTWANAPLALNIKRAEFRCVPVFREQSYIDAFELPTPEEYTM